MAALISGRNAIRLVSLIRPRGGPHGIPHQRCRVPESGRGHRLLQWFARRSHDRADNQSYADPNALNVNVISVERRNKPMEIHAAAPLPAIALVVMLPCVLARASFAAPSTQGPRNYAACSAAASAEPLRRRVGMRLEKADGLRAAHTKGRKYRTSHGRSRWSRTGRQGPKR